MNKGFSITELALVLGITGLVTALSTPLFLNYYQASRLRVAAEEVAAIINQGRQIGIRENTGACIHVGPTALQYRVGNSCAGAAWIGPGTDAAGNIAVPDGISLETNVDPVFNYLGGAAPGAVITVRNTQDGRSPDRERGRLGPGHDRAMKRWLSRALIADVRGMTIAEVLIAVGIIGVGLLALCSAIPIAAYGINEGSQLSTATFLANQRMEQVRNARWVSAVSRHRG